MTNLKMISPFLSFPWDVILFYNGLDGCFFYADGITPLDIWDNPFLEHFMYGTDAEMEFFCNLSNGKVFGVFSVH